MRILISNDDGIRSEGLKALHDAAAGVGEVWVVAPDRERSTASHSLSLHRPLRVEKLAERWFAVDGTPTDCVNLAVNGLMREWRPQILLTGINKGANMGDDVTYSGTVSAAMEGTLLGIPSVAISLDARDGFDYALAAWFSQLVARRVVEKGLPPGILLNVNVPNIPRSECRGVRVTRQGKRIYGDAIVESVDPRGRQYYWIGGDELGFVPEEGTDFCAVSRGEISVTPLRLDMTDHTARKELARWDFEA
ncbi:MAG: 5'/3'-nucleotidase SurE [Nitrospinota bacterium]